MSERKVLNKYYPPDFDPSKIPRMKLPKNRQYTVRLMAPCNMRCKTCGEYIYKGKKFNARKEDVEGEDYLGIRIYRFYIKCTRCLQEISFKTDPRNTDYEIEAGATRNFMALKLAEEQAQREEDERKEEEASNPMKLLENRTQQSKQELELLESLEELKDLNRRQQSVDYDTMLSQFSDKEALKRLAEKQEEEDEKFIRSIYGPSSNKRVVEEEVIEDFDNDSVNISQEPPKKVLKNETVTKVVEPACKPSSNSSQSLKTGSKVNSSSSWDRSVGIMKGSTMKTSLSGLVRKKTVPVPSRDVSSKPVAPVQATSSVSVAPEEVLAAGSILQTPESSKDKSAPVSNGLALLGSYSGSETDSDN